jgi:NADP-reducing hydrogenase subunit HndC
MNSETSPVRRLLVCGDKRCRKRADCNLKKKLARFIAKHAGDARVEIVKTDCLGRCEKGPVLVVHPDGLWFGDVKRATAKSIVKRLLRRGKTVKRARVLKPDPDRIQRYVRSSG